MPKKKKIIDLLLLKYCDDIGTGKKGLHTILFSSY